MVRILLITTNFRDRSVYSKKDMLKRKSTVNNSKVNKTQQLSGNYTLYSIKKQFCILYKKREVKHYFLMFFT